MFLGYTLCLVGTTSRSLLECTHSMADWKQITARIRRARTGKDPAAQLTNLFAKTRDAMVAFELARYFESVGNTADAGRWYLTAAERFRRSDWKTKAQESATRLGATEPAEIPVPSASRWKNRLPVNRANRPNLNRRASRLSPRQHPRNPKLNPLPSGVLPLPIGVPGTGADRRGHDSHRSPRRAEPSVGQRESRPLGPSRGYTPPPPAEEETPAAAERPSALIVRGIRRSFHAEPSRPLR